MEKITNQEQRQLRNLGFRLPAVDEPAKLPPSFSSRAPEPVADHKRKRQQLQSEEDVARKRWFVVSLCDGIGGAFLALDIAKVKFDGIAAESDHDLLDFVHLQWPRLVLKSDCCKVTAEEVLKGCRRHGCQGIFLIGGPPCQPFSAAGRKRGLHDDRAGPLVAFCRLHKELIQLTKGIDITYRNLMETVASMSADARS